MCEVGIRDKPRVQARQVPAVDEVRETDIWRNFNEAKEEAPQDRSKK